jgi:periplasmic divalent cation tolerance protein
MIALIYITTSNEDESLKIGNILVKERLCACSNIIRNIESIYWWENKIENDNESVLILKTLEEKVEEVIKRVREIHTYDNPCILALPVLNVSNSYLKWLKKEIK